MAARFDIVSAKRATKLALELDEETLIDFLEYAPLSEVYKLNALEKRRVFTVERDSVASLYRYVLNAKTMVRHPHASQAVVGAYDALYNMSAERDVRLPTLRMEAQPDTLDGRRKMQAEVRWPDGIDEQQAAEFAGGHMRRFARELPPWDTFRSADLGEMAYAVASRADTWLTFETNPIGSCSLGSDHGG